MQIIFLVLTVSSLIFSAVNGSVSELSSAVFEKAEEAVRLVISLCGIITLWSGIMRVWESSGLIEKLARLLSPLVRFLFNGLNRGGRAAGLIAMNIAANILGLGNASTPLGLAAMKAIADEEGQGNGEEGNSEAASDNMIMLTVLNTASLQIIPTTAAALRAANGVEKPFDILPCVWIVSVYAAAVSIGAAKLFSAKRRRKYDKHPD